MALIFQCFLSIFPAHAGVIPSFNSLSFGLQNFPRACGGDPKAGADLFLSLQFSPRMRG